MKILQLFLGLYATKCSLPPSLPPSLSPSLPPSLPSLPPSPLCISPLCLSLSLSDSLCACVCRDMQKNAWILHSISCSAAAQYAFIDSLYSSPLIMPFLWSLFSPACFPMPPFRSSRIGAAGYQPPISRGLSPRPECTGNAQTPSWSLQAAGWRPRSLMTSSKTDAMKSGSRSLSSWFLRKALWAAQSISTQPRRIAPILGLAAFPADLCESAWAARAGH